MHQVVVSGWSLKAKTTGVLVVCLTLAMLVLGTTHATAGPDVWSLIDDSRYAEALTLAREQLAQAEAAHPGDSLETARALDVLIEALRLNDGLNEAGELAARALAIKEDLLGPDHPELATTLYYWGELLHSLHNYKGPPRSPPARPRYP